jgi:hypothetical protein
MYLGWFQVIAIFYLLFVSCLKGPKWWKSYVLYSGYIQGPIALFNFVIIPICTMINVSLNWSFIKNAKTGYFIAFYFYL